jgi:hypothetical protein
VTGFSDIIASGLATVRGAAGVEITYVRGADTVTLTATKGRSDLETMTGDVTTVVRSDDWIVAAADLELSGDLVTPKRDDKVKMESGGVVYVYAVTTPPYSPCDNERTHIRIHSKYVGTEGS